GGREEEQGGEMMEGMGDQGERVGEKPDAELGQRECEVEGGPDRERGAVAGRGRRIRSVMMVMPMAVVVVAVVSVLMSGHRSGRRLLACIERQPHREGRALAGRAVDAQPPAGTVQDV